MNRGFPQILTQTPIIWLIPILLLALIGLSIYMILKNNHKERDAGTHQALEILNERFARGEIDEADFLKKKKNLLNQ